MKENNKWKYAGDSRYMKVYNNMQLLGIQDVTTERQHENGTIVWRLPILSDRAGRYIEYASFKSGYVRNQGVDCRSNWQINKCKMGKRHYKYPNGKEYTFDMKERILIPIEIERLEYMMKYIIKNEFTKRANTVQKGNFVPKWKYDMARESEQFAKKRSNEYMDKFANARGYVKEIAPEMPNEVTVIIDGHKYKVI